MLQKLLKKHDAVIFLDTETSGLDPHTNRIIEFAAIKVRKFHKNEEIDEFVRLPAGERIPKEVVELTGITDDILIQDGIHESALAIKIAGMIGTCRHPLIVAHNAQFDVLFLEEFVKRNAGIIDFKKCDYLDTLSVFRDRAEYPHRLKNAISYYGLDGKVQNSHRAIDDVRALIEVVKQMEIQRNDLDRYVNLFGYLPKYGLTDRIEGVTYKPYEYSDFRNGIRLPSKVIA